MRPLALLAILAVSGCAELMGGCGEPTRGPFLASWTGPALYGQLPGRVDGTTFSYNDSQPRGGIPFENATLRAQWGNYSLDAVGWTPRDDRVGAVHGGLSLHADGVVEGVFAASVLPSALRAWFLDFARNVSADREENLSARADAFAASHVREEEIGTPTAQGLENRTTLVTHRVALAALAVEGLYARLAPAGDVRTEPPRYEGPRAEFTAGDWHLSWSLPFRNVTGSARGMAFVLTATVVDDATFLIEVPRKLPETELDAARLDVFRALGLPAPAPAGFHYSGPIC